MAGIDPAAIPPRVRDSTLVDPGSRRAQAIGRSRGGGATKIHTLTDAAAHRFFMLIGGNVLTAWRLGIKAASTRNH